MASAGELDEVKSPPTNVFLSRVDTYFGKILAQHLAGSVVSDPGSKNADIRNDGYFDLLFLDIKGKKDAYQVHGSWHPVLSAVGSTNAINPPKVPGAQTLNRTDNESAITSAIKTCSICIFHVIDEDGENEVLSDAIHLVHIVKQLAQETQSKKTLILVTTSMTWAKTIRPGSEAANPDGEPSEPITEDDEEEEGEGLTEDNFRKRKPHPNYRQQLELEKDLLKFGRDSKGLLTTTVVVAGVVYGYGENCLHWMFKTAWQNPEGTVAFFGNGRERIPLIHARDLCQVVQSICGSAPKKRYIIATDGVPLSLTKIAEAVSKHLANGLVTRADPKTFLLNKKVTKSHLDILSTNLHLAPAYIKDQMNIRWVAEKGFTETIAQVVQEYKTVRQVTPIKIVILGPPLSGKTFMAKRLSEFYELHYLDVDKVLDEAITALRKTIQVEKAAKLVRKENPEDDKEDEPEGPTKGELAREMLDKIDKAKEGNNGVMPNELVNHFVHEKLLSIKCQNQGFVLDGYPDSFASVNDLFAHRATADGDEEGEEPEIVNENDDGSGSPLKSHDHKITPDYVIRLEISEDLLRSRVMLEPDAVIKSSAETTEEKFIRRVKEYNELNKDSNDPINYFDEIEVPTITLPLAKDPDSKMTISLQTVFTRIGPPHNYGLTNEERQAIVNKERVLQESKGQEQQKAEQTRATLDAADRRRHCGEWAVLTDDARRLRHQVVQNATEPTSKFLTEHVLPAVQDGLAAILEVRPEDPIDFLGDYLLQLRDPERMKPPLKLDEKLVWVAKG